MKLARFFLVTLLLTFFSINLYSRDKGYSAYISRAEITVGSKLALSDGLLSGIDNVLLRELVVDLKYSRNTQSDLETSALWEYELGIKVYPADNPGNFSTHTLIIKYGADGEYVYNSVAVIRGISEDHQVAEVTSIDARYSTNGGSSYTDLSGTSASTNINLPKDVYLVFRMQTEHYSYLDPTIPGAIYYDVTTQEIRWRAIEEAEEYDVEWVYIDSADLGYTTFTTNNADPFEYKEPSRVRTSATNFFLPLIYPRGKLFFRMRPVGRFIDDGVDGNYTHIKTGAWGYKKYGASGDEALYVITTGFEKDKIWQYQVSYAENGKNKRLVSYYDKTLRNRQSASSINSEDVTLVAETKYDYEGRAALSILPAPVPGFDLGYKTNFNVGNSSLDSYEKEFFDKNTPEAMFSPTSGEYGAAQYYSANNGFSTDPFRNLIPTSTFPFTQTEFLDDNTGRVKSASGVGKDHIISSGHDTKYLYGTTTSSQLQRLFGSNVGKAHHYKTTTVLDANRQGSINYMDETGRTIATALVGDAPNNLNGIAPSSESITVDLTENNNYDQGTGEINVTYRISNIETTEYEFEYEFSAAHFPQGIKDPSSSNTENICVECDYKLEITLMKPNGDWAQMEKGSPASNVTKIEEIYSGKDLSCGTAGNTAMPVINFSANLSMVGDYILSKKLTVVINEDSIDARTESTMTTLGIDLNSMIATHIAAVDTTLCDVTCEDHCLTRVLHANPTWTLSTHETQILAAVAACVDDWCMGIVDSSISYTNGAGQGTQCMAIYDQMIVQVSPGGWYYESNNSSSTGRVSDFWQEMDTKQGNDEFLLSDGVTVASTSEIRDPSLWNSDWAEIAVELHREYCHYELCMDFQDSKAYDVMMGIQKGWTAAGDYNDPLNTPEKDPILSVNVTLSNSITFYGTTYSGTVSMGTMITQAFNNFNGTEDLDDFVDDPSSGLYSPAVPYNDANKYAAFVPLYGGIKSDLIRLIKEANGCHCYDDDNAITKCQPDLKDPTVRDQIVQDGNNFWSGGCEELCTMNVYAWMEKLNSKSAGALYASSADSTYAYDALYDFCLNNPQGCGLGNPLGLITSGIYNSTGFNTVKAVFDSLNIEMDTILAGGVITPCDSIILSYRAHPDLQYLIDFLNNAYLPYVDTLSGPSWTAFEVDSSEYSNLIDRGIWRAFSSLSSGSQSKFIPFNGDDCQLYLVVDSSDYKNLLNPSLVNQFYLPYYSATTPFSTTLVQADFYNDWLGISAIYFLNLRMKVLYNGEMVDAYLYSSNPSGSAPFCFSPLLIEDTICLSQIDSGAIATTPPFDFSQRKVDCIDFLKKQATYNATQQYQNYRDSIRDQILEGYRIKCMNGASEKFSCSYELKEYHYTLYYYDLAGNLVQTVPPEGVDVVPSTAFDSNGKWDGTTEPKHRLTTHYAYNSYNQLIWQVTPDGGGTDFYYNSLGQLRFSQNQKQKALNDFSFTKYDEQGRITEVGETHETTLGDIVANINDDAYPTKGWQITRTFYDDIAFVDASAEFDQGEQQNLRSRVVSTIAIEGTSANNTLPADEDKRTATHYSYDPHGNVKEILQESSISEYIAPLKNIVQYQYDLISGNVLEVNYQPGKVDEFNHRYAYDGDNRLLTAETSQDGYIWDMDARYHYYLHGPLARVEVGQDHVQSSDYAYTIHGWLKSINAATGRADLDPGLDGWNTGSANLNKYDARDVFGIGIGYYDYPGQANYNDYSGIGNNTHLMGTLPIDMFPYGYASAKKYHLFNGNIGHLTYSLPETGLEQWMPTIIKGFNYDQLNRINSMKTLIDASYSYKAANGFGGQSFGSEYETEYTYDANGNILSLKRNGHSGANLNMDDMTYGYATDGNGDIVNNRLRQVQDIPSYSGNYSTDIDWYASFTQGTATTSDNYQYDLIGNLVKDQSEEIDNIEWNVQGKVWKITRSSGSTRSDLEFIYGPDGNRVAKIEKKKNGSGGLLTAKDWIITRYVRDASGNVMSHYKQTFEKIVGEGNRYSTTISQAEIPIFGSSRLGMKTGTSSQTAYFTAVSGTGGWSESLEQSTAPINFADGLQMLPSNGNPISITPSTTTQVTLRAVGETVRLGVGGYSVVSGTLTSVGEYQDLAPGDEAVISVTDVVNLTFDGVLILNGDNNLDISSLGYLAPQLLSPYEANLYLERKLENKNYEFTDHLGNVLATITDKKIGKEKTIITTVVNEDYSDSGNDWVPIAKSIIEYDSPHIYVRSEEEESRVKKIYSLDTDQNCTQKICIDVAVPDENEIKLTFIIQNSSETQLYSYTLEVGSTNCFTGLSLPDDFILVIEASAVGDYTIDNVVIEDHCLGLDYYLADVTSAQDYYPFGSIMPGRKFHPAEGMYRYGFNGKEQDGEVNNSEGTQYDYGFRIYNPRIGKFLSIDPLTSSFPMLSSYQFAANIPTRFIDLDGLETYDIMLNADHTRAVIKKVSNSNDSQGNRIFYIKKPGVQKYREFNPGSVKLSGKLAGQSIVEHIDQMESGTGSYPMKGGFSAGNTREIRPPETPKLPAPAEKSEFVEDKPANPLKIGEKPVTPSEISVPRKYMQNFNPEERYLDVGLEKFISDEVLKTINEADDIKSVTINVSIAIPMETYATNSGGENLRTVINVQEIKYIIKKLVESGLKNEVDIQVTPQSKENIETYPASSTPEDSGAGSVEFQITKKE